MNGKSGSSSAARGTVLLVGSRCFFMVAGYLISLVLARGLGPAQYGVYGVVMSFLLWIEMAGTAGLPGALSRLIPQQAARAEAVERTSQALLIVWSLILFALCWLLAPLIARMFNLPEATWLFRVAFLDIPFNGVYVAYQGICNGHRRFGMLSAGFALYALTKLVGTLVLLALGLSVSGALIVNVCATIGGIAFFVLKNPPRGLGWDMSLVKMILRIALGMGAYVMILQVLLTLDLWMLQSLWKGDEATIGYYVAALNVAKLPMVVPSALSGVVFASVAWARESGDKALAQRYLQAATRFALVLLVPCCALAVAHSRPIMSLLYSEQYSAGGVFLSVQVIGISTFAFLDAYLHSLMAIDRRKAAVLILLSLLPIAAVLNLLLIPRWGGLGAATALSLTLFLGTLIATAAAAREFGSLIRPLTLGRVFLATGAVVFLGNQFPVEGVWLIAKLAVLMGIYVLLLGLLREVTGRDLHPFAVWQRKEA